MGMFLDPEGPLMTVLSRIANVVVLNILFLITCIPVVTIGASVTALYYVMLKIVEDREGYVIKSYFQAFAANFKQSTLLWLILLPAYIVLGVDLVFLSQNGQGGKLGGALFVVIAMVVFLVLSTGLYTFPLQARFANTKRNTLKNALLLSIAHLPRTIVMLLVSAMFLVVSFYNAYCFPLLFLCTFSLPVLIHAALLKKVFKKITPEQENVQDGGIFTVSDKMEKEERGKK